MNRCFRNSNNTSSFISQVIPIFRRWTKIKQCCRFGLNYQTDASSDLWPLCSLWGNWLRRDHKSLWTSPTQVASTGAGRGSRVEPRFSCVCVSLLSWDNERERARKTECRIEDTHAFILYAAFSEFNHIEKKSCADGHVSVTVKVTLIRYLFACFCCKISS